MNSVSYTQVNKDCTVVVGSCDKYADLLGPFITLFRKYWPSCPFEVVLVTESDPHVKGFDRTILTGVGKPWCRMMTAALEQIESTFVLLLMDDYLIESPVDTQRLLQRLEEAERFNAASLRLNPNPPGRKTVAGTGLLEMPKNVAYCVTCQTSLWRRDFLLRLVRQNKSAWEFERRGSFQIGDEPRPLLVTPTKEFPFVDAVHKGYWEKLGIEVCRANGIEINFAKRGLPPISVRIKEGLKALIFALFPYTLIVRIQNFFDIGAKEKKKSQE